MAPAPLTKVPRPAVVQTEAPTEPLNVPTGQGEKLVEPGDVENDPAGTAMQVVLPATVEYLPAAQGAIEGENVGAAGGGEGASVGSTDGADETGRHVDAPAFE